MLLTMEAATHENATRFAPPPFAKGTGDGLVIYNGVYPKGVCGNVRFRPLLTDFRFVYENLKNHFRTPLIINLYVILLMKFCLQFGEFANVHVYFTKNLLPLNCESSAIVQPL